MNRFDCIVVGAGHAGIEAAAAAARMGARTAMVTGNLDTVGKMSCNPAIGGMAKGQLAREVDAMGGLMGLATDATGIQFRLLGRSKGPAMWSPRAQCDKQAYPAWMKDAVERVDGLWPIQGECVDLLVDDQRRISGVGLRDGRILTAPRVVLTTGTFMRGIMHQGDSQTQGGRMGDAPAIGINAALERLGLRLLRQKTGTPCRIHAASVRWDLCEEQPGDSDPRPFSFLTRDFAPQQVSCWTCHTEPAAHDIIRANLHRAPMYNGQIDSTGPRYCPSIEDKVVRFADRERHHLFLEPEGRHTQEVYVNGLSTSLPMDVQDAILQTIPALADAHVLRYGYAVEYDMVPAEQLDHSLAVRSVPGLYLAGQINGTSGYEEAAIQGLLAGANAIASLEEREPLILSRADAYAGVLVDDLVRRAPEEPYRMFTSRAEHRLHLRADNADRRLTPLAARYGLVDAQRAAAVSEREAAIAALRARIDETTMRRVAGEGMDLVTTRQTIPELADADPMVAEQVWIELRYDSYLKRQQATIGKLQRYRDLPLEDCERLAAIGALSSEGRSALRNHRPRTLGEAERLEGMKQSDVELLWSALQRPSTARKDL